MNTDNITEAFIEYRNVTKGDAVAAAILVLADVINSKEFEASKPTVDYFIKQIEKLSD